MDLASILNPDVSVQSGADIAPSDPWKTTSLKSPSTPRDLNADKTDQNFDSLPSVSSQPAGLEAPSIITAMPFGFGITSSDLSLTAAHDLNADKMDLDPRSMPCESSQSSNSDKASSVVPEEEPIASSPLSSIDSDFEDWDQYRSAKRVKFDVQEPDADEPASPVQDDTLPPQHTSSAPPTLADVSSATDDQASSGERDSTVESEDSSLRSPTPENFTFISPANILASADDLGGRPKRVRKARARAEGMTDLSTIPADDAMEVDEMVAAATESESAPPRTPTIRRRVSAPGGKKVSRQSTRTRRTSTTLPMDNAMNLDELAVAPAEDNLAPSKKGGMKKKSTTPKDKQGASASSHTKQTSITPSKSGAARSPASSTPNIWKAAFESRPAPSLAQPAAGATTPRRESQTQAPAAEIEGQEVSIEPAPKPKRPRGRPRKAASTLLTTDTSPTTAVHHATQQNMDRRESWPNGIRFKPVTQPTSSSQVFTPNQNILPLPASTIDAHLLNLSVRLMEKTAIAEKPEAMGQPEVWADERQALNETLPYYRSTQGGCYQTGGVVYSFMLDKHSALRDFMDDEVIICRAGGGSGKNAEGETVQSDDQKEGSQTRAIDNAIAHQSPIVIICGGANTDVPSKMPHRFSVLGWFIVTHKWFEKTGGKLTIKYRFEKLELDTISWWAPRGKDPIVKCGQLERPNRHVCSACGKESEQVYVQGWMCLHSSCEKQWKLFDGSDPVEQQLSYDPRFLKQKVARLDPVATAPHSLKPRLPNSSDRMGDDVTKEHAKGLCCPRCGKCSSRIHWSGWICSNKGCGFRYSVPHVLIPANTLHDSLHPTTNSYAKCANVIIDHKVGVAIEVRLSHNYRIVTYRVPGVDGCITHMIANKTVVQEARGPDEMFEFLQEVDFGLERRKLQREAHMEAFAMNYGEAYDFVAAGDSRSFDGAPWPITEARTRLTWAARKALGERFPKSEDFNEMLALGYMEGRKIGYHDDGEDGLGPTVATLSLGEPADMLFCVHEKHVTGSSPAGIFTDSMPLPFTERYEERKVEFEKLRQLPNKPTDKQKKEIASRLGLRKPKPGKDRKAFLKLRLGHGDIVIMHGEDIQKYLLVSITPESSIHSS